ncbi:hypothetical protein AV530_007426 [Patagioenas fasciata monilis]|uniref:Uncharacterized protein n=1 Tax=Patagioenas fasciata monilis TaxID=372326 RepID=A0A1V4JXX6_PATFA|nr:hypothetical protein AV530_007426 [Patagioenas fasciata monilis]
MPSPRCHKMSDGDPSLKNFRMQPVKQLITWTVAWSPTTLQDLREGQPRMPGTPSLQQVTHFPSPISHPKPPLFGLRITVAHPSVRKCISRPGGHFWSLAPVAT